MIYEKNEADTQRDTAETRLYLSHMAQVRNDIENGRPQSAHELLALHERASPRARICAVGNGTMRSAN